MVTRAKPIQVRRVLGVLSHLDQQLDIGSDLFPFAEGLYSRREKHHPSCSGCRESG
jgi:hypothetical protein